MYRPGKGATEDPNQPWGIKAVWDTTMYSKDLSNT